MIGVEFVTDRKSKTPAKAFATKVVQRAFQNGLLLLECGASGIRLIPPLMIDEKVADEGMSLLEKAMEESASELK